MFLVVFVPLVIFVRFVTRYELRVVSTVLTPVRWCSPNKQDGNTSLILALANKHEVAAVILVPPTGKTGVINSLKPLRVGVGDRVHSTADHSRTGVVEVDDKSGQPYKVRWNDGTLSWHYPKDVKSLAQHGSALMMASRQGLTSVVTSLLEAGAKPDLTDEVRIDGCHM